MYGMCNIRVLTNAEYLMRECLSIDVIDFYLVSIQSMRLNLHLSIIGSAIQCCNNDNFDIVDIVDVDVRYITVLVNYSRHTFTRFV